jgi:hypothetical protein
MATSELTVTGPNGEVLASTPRRVSAPLPQHSITLTLPLETWTRFVGPALQTAWVAAREIEGDDTWAMRYLASDCIADGLEQIRSLHGGRYEMATLTHPALRRLDHWLNRYWEDEHGKIGRPWSPRTFVNDTYWSAKVRLAYVTVMGVVTLAQRERGDLDAWQRHVYVTNSERPEVAPDLEG